MAYTSLLNIQLRDLKTQTLSANFSLRMLTYSFQLYYFLELFVWLELVIQLQRYLKTQLLKVEKNKPNISRKTYLINLTLPASAIAFLAPNFPHHY